MQSRKQADQLSDGDCVAVTSLGYYEILRLEKQNGKVVLQVLPTSCGAENCPSACGCHYSLFDGQEGPFELRVDSKKRLEFHGNLEEDEAQLKLLAARVKQRRAGRNGISNGPQTDVRKPE